MFGKATPLGKRLLLRAVAAPEKEGRFWLPPAAQSDYALLQAEIVQRGADVKDWRLQPGVRVITRRFGGVRLGNDGYWVAKEEDVLAIVKA